VSCVRFQEKLYQWIRRQQEGGSRVAPVDILGYIQVGFILWFFLCFACHCEANKMREAEELWRAGY